MNSMDRRHFLKLSAHTLTAAGIASLLPKTIRDALAQTTQPTTLDGIDHIIIFIQENRSFDHYFGMLPGVRGFADPYPAPLPSGRPVWYQPNLTSGSYAARDPDGNIVASVIPYPLNPDSDKSSFYQGINLDHSWKGSQGTWGNWNAWVKQKGFWTMATCGPKTFLFTTN